MLKKTINYQDYNGDNRSEDFYFNLTNAELTEMQLVTTGGLTAMLERIMQTRDIPTMYKFFKEIVLKSYGEKSLDGRKFVKIDDNGHPLSRDFEQTEAYSVLMTELMANNDDAVEKFVEGVLPSSIADLMKSPEIKKQIEDQKSKLLS